MISGIGISPNSRARRARRASGFTLLELLVVLFIIGITLGFATLTIDTQGGADQLEQEAKRLEALIDIAGEEAVLFGIEIGLDLTPDGYRFLRLDSDGWSVVAGSQTPLHPRELPEGVQLRLLQTDQDDSSRAEPFAPRGAAAETNDEDDEDDAPRPEVLFLSSGEFTPFEMELFDPEVAPRYLYQAGHRGELAMRKETPAGS